MQRFRGSLILVFLAASLAAAQGPALKVDTADWDFGELLQGALSERIYRLENVGTSPLEITKVGVTCGCVSAAADESTVAPGAGTNLVIKLNTRNVGGKIAKQVWIETNDPKHPKSWINVRGEVQPLWWFSTNGLTMGELEHGKAATGTLRLHVRAGRTLAIKGLHPSSGNITVTSEPFGKVESEHGFEIRVVIGEEAPIGPLRVAVQVETDSEIKPMDQFTILAEVEGPIAVRPRDLSFGPVRPKEARTLSVEIENRSPTPIAITKIWCSDPQISFELIEKDPGRRFEVKVILTPNGRSRLLAGRIFLSTDFAPQKMLGVTWRGTLTPP